MKKRKDLTNLFCRVWHKLFARTCDSHITEQKVLKVLENVSVIDPKKRKPDIWDEEFIRLVPVLHHYDKALEMLNKYGWLSKTYFENLKDADKNVALQRTFCRIRKNAYQYPSCSPYSACYGNLLYGFLEHWDLLPEIKEEIFDDPDFEPVVKIYELFRELQKY